MGNPTRAILAVLIILAILACIMLVYTLNSEKQGNDFSKMKVAEISVYYNKTKQTFNAYVASNYTEQVYGLMYKTTLSSCNRYGNCEGMLFAIYNSTPANICFWMKNTGMPLNIYWIANDTIIAEALNATPYSTKQICNIGNWVLETPKNITFTTGSKVAIAIK